jgi:hypothetical protein
MYSEETDLCLRLARAGWETHYLPSAVVVHHDSALRDEVPRERIAEEWRSRHRYWRKHHGERGARAAALAAGAQYVARAGIAAAANRVRPGVFDPSFPDRMRLHARAALLHKDARGLRELAERWNEEHVAGAQDRASWWSGEGEEALRALLVDVWDPLGVRGEPAAADEYDALLPAIARQLERRVPPGVLAAHLRRIRTEELGIAEVAIDDRAAAEAVLAWYEGAREEREARA